MTDARLRKIREEYPLHDGKEPWPENQVVHDLIDEIFRARAHGAGVLNPKTTDLFASKDGD